MAEKCLCIYVYMTRRNIVELCLCSFTLFRLILGDFDFPALQQANRVLGPAFFCLYIFFVFFIL